ncbi:MAG: hypothetical protein WC780_01265 [Lentimicrobiaceae bacterium]
MQKATLKISSILLCGLLIYNSLGYFLVLSVMRMAVRQQKWAQLSTLPEQQLTTFIFTRNIADSRLKILDQREILVDGKLYDVVRKTDDGKQIKYFCVYDHEEETLISKTRLFNSKAQQMPLQSTARNIIDKIIKSGIFTEKTFFLTENPISFNPACKGNSYSDPIIQVSSPPPQQLS